jgi:hypothetical protein
MSGCNKERELLGGIFSMLDEETELRNREPFTLRVDEDIDEAYSWDDLRDDWEDDPLVPFTQEEYADYYSKLLQEEDDE